MRHRKPENWLDAVSRQGHGIAETRDLETREQASEAMLMGLRLAEGVDLAAMAARFGLPEAGLSDGGKRALYQRQGLVWHDGPRIGVTEAGMPVLDALLGELVPEDLVSPLPA